MRITKEAMEAIEKADKEGRVKDTTPAKPLFRPGVSEKEFQNAVLAFATRCGWMCYHTFDSRRSVRGFPDLTMVRGNVLIFAELKVEPNKATADQLNWLEALKAANPARVFLWYPKDWPQIEEILK